MFHIIFLQNDEHGQAVVMVAVFVGAQLYYILSETYQFLAHVWGSCPIPIKILNEVDDEQTYWKRRKLTGILCKCVLSMKRLTWT